MLKILARDSALLTASNFFTKGIGLLMLPAYTRLLLPAQYGLYDYILVISSVLSVLVALEVSQGLMRYASAPEHKEISSTFHGTGLIFSFFSAAFFLFLIACFSVQLSSVLFSSEEYAGVLTAGLAALFFTVQVRSLSVSLRADGAIMRAAFLPAAFAALTAAMSIVFLMVMDGGVKEIFVAQALSGAICLCAGYWLHPLRRFMRFKAAALKRMLLFSLPLVVSSIAVVISVFADRFFIERFMGLSEVGLYGVAFRVASVVVLMVGGLQSAMMPLIYRTERSSSASDDLVRVQWTFLAVAVGLVCTFHFSGPFLVAVLAGEEYMAATALVPLLVLSALFQAGAAIFPSLMLQKKTVVFAAIQSFSALLNVGLNILLIPVVGLFGAAAATVLSMFLSFSLVALWGRGPDRRRILIIVSIFFLLLLATLWFNLPEQVQFHVAGESRG